VTPEPTASWSGGDAGTASPTPTSAASATPRPGDHGFDDPEYIRGSGRDLVHVIQRDFSEFAGWVAVDGVRLTAGQYDVRRGSTVTTLYAAYLETLADGEHTLTVGFRDDAVTEQFWIGRPAEPQPTAAVTPSASVSPRPPVVLPGTGATASQARVWGALLALAVGLQLLLAARARRW
jgi:hypothetical protein